MVDGGARRASDYDGADIVAIKATCLELGLRLKDYCDDIVIVGGVVPTMLARDVDPDDALGLGAHVGSKDVDLGLSLAIIDEARYEAIAERLADAGFGPDVNEDGHEVKSTWTHGEYGSACPIDFLIQADPRGSRLGRAKHLTGKLAAMRMPYIDLAFVEPVPVLLKGRALSGGVAERTLRFCCPAAFIALKAHAFDGRAREKDAYDLYYMLRHHVAAPSAGAPPADVARRWDLIRGTSGAKESRRILQRDFGSTEHVGPRAVETFLGRDDDPELRADVFAYVKTFLQETKRRRD